MGYKDKDDWIWTPPTTQNIVHQDDFWVHELGNLSKIKKINLLEELFTNPDECRSYPGIDLVRMMREPELLSMAAKILLNVDLLPMQAVIIAELWKRPFSIFVASRGMSKSFSVSLLCLLKTVLIPKQKTGPGIKICVVSASFRQSKIIHDYIENFWNNSTYLRSIAGPEDGPRQERDRCRFRFGGNQVTALPLGNGDKIRGERAGLIVCDEINSVPIDIFETVVKPFAAVTASPITNVAYYNRKRYYEEKGTWDQMKDDDRWQLGRQNQMILAGSAGFQFQPFYNYFKRYKAIIESGGDRQKLREVFPDGDIPRNFNHRDYCIVRLPYELIPEGFMAENVVAEAKANSDSATYKSEYGCCFMSDTNGFFKASLIRQCSRPEVKVLKHSKQFTESPDVLGYLFGIDPASERDNFSICVMEVRKSHARIVHIWTTTRKSFEKRFDKGLTKISDFYGYCARKIRDLMVQFPPLDSHPLGACIAMDSQGGGRAVAEALHDHDKLDKDAREVPIWEIVDPAKPKDSDMRPGYHCLFMMNFANPEIKRDSYHGLRKDMEDGFILFPDYIDTIALEEGYLEDKVAQLEFQEKYNEELRLYDSYEDIMHDVDELKRELATIVQTRTDSGQDRWDTPERKTSEGRKGRMKKDRASALICANYLYHGLYREKPKLFYDSIGGTVASMSGHKSVGAKDEVLYGRAPEWFKQGMNSNLGVSYDPFEDKEDGYYTNPHFAH